MIEQPKDYVIRREETKRKENHLFLWFFGFLCGFATAVIIGLSLL